MDGVKEYGVVDWKFFSKRTLNTLYEENATMKSRAHEIALKSQKKFTRFDASKNFSVQLALLDGMEATKEGLMALAVQTGL